MTPFRRRIDHLVVAVRDLEAAAAFYNRIGFQVGARNRHPWGTENRLVQFASSFIELITVPEGGTAVPPHRDGVFSFGAFVRDYLRRREGLAMIVLSSHDAVTDAAFFAQRGIGSFAPFPFEREGKRPDGTPTRVGFSLAFALDPAMPDTAFFVCQQHYPENFWNADFQQHANGTSNVSAVTLAVAHPRERAGFLEAFSGASAVPRRDGVTALHLSHGGRLELVAAANDLSGPGATVRVPELAPLIRTLEAARCPHGLSPDGAVIAPADAFGMRLAFEVGHHDRDLLP